MSESVVHVVALSKRYRIGLPNRHPTVREALMDAASGTLRALRAQRGGACEAAERSPFVWALRGVDLDVREGQVLGIVGRNGSGKSALLKILAGVTEPTGGHADLRGRVGSLLEVGAGFHPELTGRDNIFMNGAMLGMRRQEIRRRFDEIVAFAEVERFLDTPVKRYSSGMYTRLGFAVAAHLEADLLLIDEVLAVADAAFQQRCLAKIGELAGDGRTLLCVSHNMAAIGAVCDEVLWLDRGAVREMGPTAGIVAHYVRAAESERGAGATTVGPHAPRGEMETPAPAPVHETPPNGRGTVGRLVARTASVLGQVADHVPLDYRDFRSYARHSNAAPYARHTVDFFDSDVRRGMPETVYVVGTGRNGAPLFDAVPAGAYVIALNKAVLVSELRPSLWMAFAPELPSRDWWQDAMRTRTPRLFGRKLPLLFPCEYSFHADPSLHATSALYLAHRLIPGVLRGGATIAGCAIQAAYYAGCRRVILVGVDMFGRTYFDGSASCEDGKDGEWVERDTLNSLIRLVTSTGVECVSLSATTLNVQRV